MKTVTTCVADIIASQPYIEEALERKIINYSALADDLRETVSAALGKDIKSGAIMMALRRYAPPTATKKSMRLEQVLTGIGDITVRSSLTDFTFQNSPTLVKSHAQILERITANRNVFYAFTRGIHESTIIISASESEIIKNHFKGELLLELQDNLSAISISLPEGNSKISGLYYQIFKRLAWEGISLHEVISTTNEFIILVEDDLIDRAFSVVKRLKFL